MRRNKNTKFILALLAVIVPVLLSFIPLSRDGLLRFTAMDVGQGDALLFEFPEGQTMLIDSGTRSKGKEVTRFLRSRGVAKIDILVNTHPHEDHIGGLLEIMDSFTVGKVWDSGYLSASRTQEEFLKKIDKKQIRYGHPKVGFKQQIGDAQIEVISPSSLMYNTGSDANNNSLVLLVTFKEISFLLMGDLEREGRVAIKKVPPVTVLKMAHHGSITGVDKAFLEKTQPKIAVMTFGVPNPYGHPHKETVTLLEQQEIPWKGTSNGSILIETDGITYKVTQPVS